MTRSKLYLLADRNAAEYWRDWNHWYDRYHWHYRNNRYDWCYVNNRLYDMNNWAHDDCLYNRYNRYQWLDYSKRCSAV